MIPTLSQSAAAAFDAAPLMLSGMALAWYVGVRAAIDAVTPTRFIVLTHALAMATPGSLTASWGVAVGRGDVAVSMLFSSAVSALSLALGVTLLSSPRHAEPSAGQRWWLMLGPLSGVTLLTGLSGRIGGFHVVCLLAIAAMARLLIRGEVTRAPGPPSVSAASLSLRGVQATLSVLLVGVGCWAGFQSIELVNARVGRETGDILATILFGPASALPLIGAAHHLLHQRRATEAVGSLIGSAVLLLGVTLPLLAAAWSLTNFNPPELNGNWLALAREGLPAMPFPLRTWRVDSVLIVVLSIAIAPAAFRRWSLGRLEGLLLVLLYLGYLVASVKTST